MANPSCLLRILMYHRVLEPDGATRVNPSIISATPAAFRHQMSCLAKHYAVLSLGEILAARRDRRPLPRRAVLITFDDGCRDFGEVVWPILREHHLPAAVFVPTAYPGCPGRAFWWDRLYCAFRDTRIRGPISTPFGPVDLATRESRRHALRAAERTVKATPHAEAMRLVDLLCHDLGEEAAPASDVLGWDELRALARDGADVGAHTRTHPALTQLPIEEARAEVRGSREDVQRELGTCPPVFAYPFGDYDDRVASIVGEEGFELGLTCLDGHSHLGRDEDLRLRRTNITPRTTPLVFRARLTVMGSYVDRWRHSTSRREPAPAVSDERQPARRPARRADALEHVGHR